MAFFRIHLAGTAGYAASHMMAFRGGPAPELAEESICRCFCYDYGTVGSVSTVPELNMSWTNANT